jgi:hypothetical protein
MRVTHNALRFTLLRCAGCASAFYSDRSAAGYEDRAQMIPEVLTQFYVEIGGSIPSVTALLFAVEDDSKRSAEALLPSGDVTVVGMPGAGSFGHRSWSASLMVRGKRVIGAPQNFRALAHGGSGRMTPRFGSWRRPFGQVRWWRMWRGAGRSARVRCSPGDGRCEVAQRRLWTSCRSSRRQRLNLRAQPPPSMQSRGRSMRSALPPLPHLM